MQALMNFKSTSEEILLGNEDMQENIKDMFKTFHTNLLVLQQVIEVSQTTSREFGAMSRAIHSSHRNHCVSMNRRSIKMYP